MRGLDNLFFIGAKYIHMNIMRKVNLICALGFSILSLFANAQTANFVAGPKIKGLRDIDDVKLSENNLTVLGHKSNKVSTWKLSPVSLVPGANANAIASSSSADKGNKNIANAKEYFLFNTLSLKDKDLVLYTKKQSKDKTIQLFYQFVDNDGKQLNGPTKLASHKTAKLSGLASLFGVASGPANMGYTIKTNQKKDLVFLANQGPDVKNGKKYQPAPVTLSLFDSEMNEKNSLELDLGISNYGSSAVLSNAGFVYNLVTVELDRKEAKEKRRNGEASWYYKIVGVNLNDPNAKPFEHDLVFKNRGILNASLDISANGDLICAGTYSELTSRGGVDDFDGIFYCKLDPLTGEVINDNIKKLDRDIVAELTSKRNAKRNEGVSNQFKIKGLVALPDGTSDLLLEEEYVIVVVTSNGKTTTTTYHYYAMSILVANIASNGEINWVKRIPKFQHTQNDNGIFNSFTYKSTNEGLKIVFTDNKQNYEKETGMFKKGRKDLTSSKEGKTIVLALVKPNGEIVQKKVAETQKHQVYTRTGIWNDNGSELYLQATPRIEFWKCLVGCLLPPYGFYLWLKKADPDMCLTRVEFE